MTPGALVVLADMASKKTKEKGAPSGASGDGFHSRSLGRTVRLGDELTWQETLQLNHDMAVEVTLLRGKKQRAKASASAAQERAAEAAAHKALARQLAEQVSPLITRQGKRPTARAVKKAAAEVRPATEASSRLASLSEEQIRNLIFGD